MSDYVTGYNRVMKAAAISTGVSALRGHSSSSSSSSRLLSRTRQPRRSPVQENTIASDVVDRGKSETKSNALDQVNDRTSVNLQPLGLVL